MFRSVAISFYKKNQFEWEIISKIAAVYDIIVAVTLIGVG